MKYCPKCNTTHEKNGVFCSRKCANSRGPRTDEFKSKVSKKLSGRKQTQERKLKTSGEKNGSWKGGVTKNIILCKFCGKEHTTPYRSVKFCSKACYSQFCSINKSAKLLYRESCRFKFNVYDFPEKFDLSLIDKYGWYSAKNRGNNQQGVQRDHLYSVEDGFKNNIDANVISHPANCCLLHSFENQKKRSKSNITLEDLIEKISKW